MRNDWFGYKVENAEFIGVGDTKKLYFLLRLFKEFVDARVNKQNDKLPL